MPGHFPDVHGEQAVWYQKAKKLFLLVWQHRLPAFGIQNAQRRHEAEGEDEGTVPCFRAGGEKIIIPAIVSSRVTGVKRQSAANGFDKADRRNEHGCRPVAAEEALHEKAISSIVAERDRPTDARPSKKIFPKFFLKSGTTLQSRLVV